MTSADTGALPVLRTARRASLIDQVIDQLRDQITTGAWAIGARIPTESELAQLTGTSRNTVREAVQSLVHAGLLERRQGSGTYVLASSELAGAMSRRVAGASRVHVLEVRRALEVGAARTAARRRTEEDVAQLRTLIEERNALMQAGDYPGAIAKDVDLHRAISVAAHNPLLTDLYENFLDVIGEGGGLGAYMMPALIHPEEHVDLVEAIAAGDSERAAEEAACFLDEMLEEEQPSAASSADRRPGFGDDGEDW